MCFHLFMGSNKTIQSNMITKTPNTLLTHWGRVTHICVSERTIIGSDNGLSPSRRQAIIRTNAGILLIGPSGTIFSESLIEIHTFSFTKMHLKMSSGKWRPSCLGLNVLIHLNSQRSCNQQVDRPAVVAMAWCRLGNKPLVAPMTIMFLRTLYSH